MKGFAGLTKKETDDILKQHSKTYDGYAVGNVGTNMYPISVYDDARDNKGITLTNNNNVKTYTNHRINEITAKPLNYDEIMPAYDFDSNGPIDVYPVNEYDYEEVVEYEKMEYAWADEEIDEVDVSGSQGIYGDMEPAYDFDSEGPGKAGPYQRFSYNEEEDEDFEDWEMADDDEYLRIKSGEGRDEFEDWEEIDTDLQEDFKNQKNKISEMFNRMSRYN